MLAPAYLEGHSRTLAHQADAYFERNISALGQSSLIASQLGRDRVLGGVPAR